MLDVRAETHAEEHAGLRIAGRHLDHYPPSTLREDLGGAGLALVAAVGRDPEWFGADHLRQTPRASPRWLQPTRLRLAWGW